MRRYHGEGNDTWISTILFTLILGALIYSIRLLPIFAGVER